MKQRARNLQQKLKFQPERRVFLVAPVVFFAVVLLGMTLTRAQTGASKPATSGGATPKAVAEKVVLTRAQAMEAEFRQALKTEWNALEHQLGAETKAVLASQRTREREWKAREKSARRDFFNSNDSGPEKTRWMADRKKRFEEFRKDLKHELNRVKKDQAARRAQVLADQKLRLEQFTSAIKDGRDPELSLWHPTRSAPVLVEPSTEGTPIPEVSPSAPAK
jgi:hypothetical protein